MQFNCRGMRWTGIKAESNKSMQEAGYVLITRPPSYWRLKRYGQMATSIDVMPHELPAKQRSIAEQIVKQYA